MTSFPIYGDGMVGITIFGDNFALAFKALELPAAKAYLDTLSAEDKEDFESLLYNGLQNENQIKFFIELTNIHEEEKRSNSRKSAVFHRLVALGFLRSTFFAMTYEDTNLEDMQSLCLRDAVWLFLVKILGVGVNNFTHTQLNYRAAITYAMLSNKYDSIRGLATFLGIENKTVRNYFELSVKGALKDIRFECLMNEKVKKEDLDQRMDAFSEAVNIHVLDKLYKIKPSKALKEFRRLYSELISDITFLSDKLNLFEERASYMAFHIFCADRGFPYADLAEKSDQYKKLHAEWCRIRNKPVPS